MGDIACKFGGSSLADARQMQKVVQIVHSNTKRRFVVPSAPGKRSDDDTKITDLLYLCHELARQKMDISEPFGKIETRFVSLVEDLGVEVDMGDLLLSVRGEIEAGASEAFVASRGEFLGGHVVASLLGAKFVDPADVIRFRSDGRLDAVSYELLAAQLAGPGLFVVPGFYGADDQGNIRTFTRGGSDITGAIVARAVEAEAYENWTDVSGLLMADPRMVSDPLGVEDITYREIRELSYMGASVFHDEAMFPVREVNMPIHIRNTNKPEDPGTCIRPTRPLTDRLIAGVAGKPNFTMLYIEKALMNQTRGFGRQVLEVVDKHGISYDHTPSGIDSMSVIMSDEELGNLGGALLEDIQRILQPDRVELISGLALIATVGEGMSHRVGIAARLFGALAEAKVNVRVIDQGASEINIIVGVEDADLKPAIEAIYRAFTQ
ncbi:MAG: aspartate kinase [Candidatus Latescibacteria bacterium]|jgi:aspartate kinase|nr:aspartate kinase [Candidatus Latescibacterota bacterium]